MTQPTVGITMMYRVFILLVDSVNETVTPLMGGPREWTKTQAILYPTLVKKTATFTGPWRRRFLPSTDQSFYRHA